MILNIYPNPEELTSWRVSKDARSYCSPTYQFLPSLGTTLADASCLRSIKKSGVS
jgi:hypothetical protein